MCDIAFAEVLPVVEFVLEKGIRCDVHVKYCICGISDMSLVMQ